MTPHPAGDGPIYSAEFMLLPATAAEGGLVQAMSWSIADKDTSVRIYLPLSEADSPAITSWGKRLDGEDNAVPLETV